MSLKAEAAAFINEVAIPAVWSFYEKSPPIVRCHMAAAEKVVSCSASVLQTFNAMVTQLLVTLPSNETLLVAKKTSHDLFQTSNYILETKDFNIIKNRLILSKSSWVKHPALLKGDHSRIAEMTRQSWEKGLIFLTELRSSKGDILQKGLRPPQLGALHAIAAHWSVSMKSALIVMPTGTGKTEVMLASMIMHPPQRLLVLVPSDALRNQTFQKFYSLGVLPYIDVISPQTIPPVVGMIKNTFRSENDLSLLDNCNVVVSTVMAIQGMESRLLKKFTEKFDTVFFDEAHHIRAFSWERIYEYLNNQIVLQFTATPFRLDGLRIPGRIIYNFPLRLAQAQGYFRKIHFKEVFEPDDDKSDSQIADCAVKQLRQDISAGLNHVLLARAETTDRAENLFKNIYSSRYSDLNPVLIHSKTRRRTQIIDAIKAGKHKIIVCVDMFGEGFDYAGLKIAAMHDIHKSLGVTLQFTGRFTRVEPGIGEATLVANIADPKVSEAIEDLYAEDSDWNELIPELSAKAIQSQVDFSDFLDRMESSDLSDEELFGLNVLRPKTSTVIFKIASFKPRNFRKAIKKKISRVERVWFSKDKDLVIFITRSKVPIEWATIKETSNEIWDLFILNYDQNRKLLFIYSSQTGTLHQDIAKAVGGENTQLVSGEKMFRAFHGINRLIFHNAGLYSRGKRVRFRLYTGLDIGEAIDPVAQAGATKSNLFAVGYENGRRVSTGASHKGRVWSMSSSSIPDWRQWCVFIADKILDENIATDGFLKHTLIPKEIAQLPSIKGIFAASFPYEWYSSDIENYRLIENGSDRDIHAFGISTAKIVRLNAVELLLGFEDNCIFGFTMTWGPIEGQFSVNQTSGPTLSLKRTENTIKLDEYFNYNPPILLFHDGSEIIGPRLYEIRDKLPYTFDTSRIITLDWSITDITVESKWKHGQIRNQSVQARLINELLKKNNLFVIDDDDTGEAADVIEISENADEILCRFYHCKYSSGKIPSDRVKDVYEVCGQAVRSVRWTSDPHHLIKHIISRETYLNGRSTRFEKGDQHALINLKRRLRRLRVRSEIVIVQPGLSKAAIEPEIAAILGSANAFILEITGAPLEVIASD